MNASAGSLRLAHRTAYVLGALLCLGTPGLISILVLLRVVPPGTQPVTGSVQQVGYLLTGLVFLSAAWVWWRRGRALAAFPSASEAARPGIVMRETVLFAGALETSSLCGLVYWLLVGPQALRHVWGFILLTPLLFLVLVPRYDHWQQGLADAHPGIG